MLHQVAPSRSSLLGSLWHFHVSFYCLFYSQELVSQIYALEVVCSNRMTNQHLILFQVTAEVFPPDSKKSVVRVDGEWNGKMVAKWASGSNEVFVDVSKLRIHQKICRKVAEQEADESRRLWKDVTYGLKVFRVLCAFFPVSCNVLALMEIKFC